MIVRAAFVHADAPKQPSSEQKVATSQAVQVSQKTQGEQRLAKRRSRVLAKIIDGIVYGGALMLCVAAGAVPYLVLHNFYISALVGTGGLVYFVITNVRLNLEGKSFGKNVLHLRSDQISLSSGCPLFTPLSQGHSRRWSTAHRADVGNAVDHSERLDRLPRRQFLVVVDR